MNEIKNPANAAASAARRQDPTAFPLRSNCILLLPICKQVRLNLLFFVLRLEEGILLFEEEIFHFVGQSQLVQLKHSVHQYS